MCRSSPLFTIFETEKWTGPKKPINQDPEKWPQ
jgi:hypothetical protein